VQWWECSEWESCQSWEQWDMLIEIIMNFKAISVLWMFLKQGWETDGWGEKDEKTQDTR